jgi:hypothetical protein
MDPEVRFPVKIKILIKIDAKETRLLCHLATLGIQLVLA